MFKKKLLLTAAIISSTLLTGCMSSGVKVANTRPVDVPATNLAPSPEKLKAQMNGQGQKIIISPVEYRDDFEAIFAKEVYDDLSQRVMKSGNIVVDRSLAQKLREELLAAEKSGQFRTSGPAIADVALMAKIVNLNFGKSFTEASYWVDNKGYSHKSEAYCKFSSDAKLHIRAYLIPSMKLVNTYEYEGSSSAKSETRNSNCPVNEAGMQGMMSAAIADAVKSGSGATLNDLAPESYVIERRDDVNDPSLSIFRVTIGKKHGAMEGATVNFFRKEEKVTPITNEKRIENVLIGSGELTSDIDNQGSYVLVEDEQLIDAIKIGDIAKLERGKCDFDENEILGQCIKIPNLF